MRRLWGWVSPIASLAGMLQGDMKWGAFMLQKYFVCLPIMKI